MKDYIVVIGASNIDIGGHPYKKLVAGDSNPGRISISYGGVGRNIAHNLALLGVDTKLITAAGKDVLGREMLRYCHDAGIDTDHSLISDDMRSSMYMYINDDSGNMDLAVSHVEITDLIDPEYIDSLKDIINHSAAVISDSNISRESLIHLIDICSVPVYIDTVSTAHSSKIKGCLRGIDTIKPNKLEAEYLTDITISDDNGYVKAAQSIQVIRDMWEEFQDLNMTGTKEEIHDFLLRLADAIREAGKCELTPKQKEEVQELVTNILVLGHLPIRPIDSF